MPGSVAIERRMDHASLRKPLPFSAFKEGPILRVECLPGLVLYKLTDGGAIGPDGRLRVGPTGHITPWWFGYESFTVSDPRHGTVKVAGVAQAAERAGRTATSIGDYLRSRGAVCYDWNDLTHLLVVKLVRSVVGLLGPCAGQPFYDDIVRRQAAGASNVSFIGGEQQFYLPGMDPRDVMTETFGTMG